MSEKRLGLHNHGLSRTDVFKAFKFAAKQHGPAALVLTAACGAGFGPNSLDMGDLPPGNEAQALKDPLDTLFDDVKQAQQEGKFDPEKSYSLAYLSTVGTLSAQELTATWPNVIPILNQAGEVTAIASPIMPVTLVGSLLGSPSVAKDLAEGVIMPIYDTEGNVVTYTQLTTAQAALLRTGNVNAVYRLDDYNNIQVYLENNNPAADAQAGEVNDAKAVANEQELQEIEINLPPDWKKPPKDYCGEDLVKYYAYLLTSATFGMLIMDDYMEKGQKSVTYDEDYHKKIDSFLEGERKIAARLQEKNCYSYTDKSGSVFTDYKLMRDLKFRYYGAQKKEFALRFNINTPIKDVFKAALKEVNTWW